MGIVSSCHRLFRLHSADMNDKCFDGAFVYLTCIFSCFLNSTIPFIVYFTGQ